jgi:5-methylcytosine-specific restriction endonuclease McrA
MSFLNKPIVLKLNANWKAIGVITPEEAFTAMSRQKQRHYTKDMKRPYCAVHIEYPVLEDGNVDFQSPCTILPVDWVDWIQLPVRPYDRFVKTANNQIRIPTVVIANNYRAIPKKNPRYTKYGIWLRDNFTCQITGDKLTHKTGNIDHWIPRNKRGESTFENCLLLRKDLNSKKGDMTMEDFCKKHGYPLPKRPKTPSETPVINNNFEIRDWDLFLD